MPLGTAQETKTPFALESQVPVEARGVVLLDYETRLPLSVC